MKLLFFLFLFFIAISCSNDKSVYWCGDHPCINTKEKKAYFKKTMIVEKRLQKIKDKDRSEVKKITEQAKVNEKKRIKEEKELAKIEKLSNKEKIKREKKLLKQAKINEKRRLKEEKKLKKQLKSEEKKSKKNKKKNTNTKILISDGKTTINVSEFNKLVEKINKKSMLQDYPNINKIGN